MIRKHQGFTLIEIMVVVAIIGIIAAVAIPSYTSYVVQTNQSDAKDKLTEVMFQQERFILRNRTYTEDLGDLGFDDTNGDIDSDKDFYTISASQCVGGIALTRCVLITATPKAGVQAGSGVFTLNSRGQKTYDGAGASIRDWK